MDHIGVKKFTIPHLEKLGLYHSRFIILFYHVQLYFLQIRRVGLESISLPFKCHFQNTFKEFKMQLAEQKGREKCGCHTLKFFRELQCSKVRKKIHTATFWFVKSLKKVSLQINFHQCIQKWCQNSFTVFLYFFTSSWKFPIYTKRDNICLLRNILFANETYGWENYECWFEYMHFLES